MSGDVAIGLALGANVLVGGSRRSIALQPLSVEGHVGVDVTLGVSRLGLRAASWVLNLNRDQPSTMARPPYFERVRAARLLEAAS